MKTIKLDHHLAEQVRVGTKTSTWRMFDDKNLSVNDEIAIIDKVDPQAPESWEEVGNAVIDTIVEKRLKDVTDSDTVGHQSYETKEHMLKDFQQHYGPQVTLNTPVKMIHFTLLSKSDKKITTPTTHLEEAKLFADGGSRGNPGPSASGYVLYDMDDNIVVKKGVYLGITTNNQAEYQALRFGLEEALRSGVRTVHVYLDSMLVVNQMLGIFQVKNRDLWPIHDAIKKQVAQFKQVNFTHVPRALNKEADSAVNEALDAQLKHKR
jgi:ribonuclease HI